MKIENEFIPYEQALALKELGFNEECFRVKLKKSPEQWYTQTDYEDYPEQKEEEVLIPLWQQAFDWFREKYGIIGNVNDNCILENTYSISISKIFDSRILYVNGRNHNLKDKQGFTTYEEAELECLKKLIEIVKNGKK